MDPVPNARPKAKQAYDPTRAPPAARGRRAKLERTRSDGAHSSSGTQYTTG